ncbi:hypothetical protein CYG49_03530 [Candidatus Saccharibacteria bacterium]|nr:MAG: hypothetical protein CYG49_03530 [Candidatus Saccharibacteria bacterium]
MLWWVIGLIISFTVAVLAISTYLTPDDLRACADAPTANDSQCEKADVIVAISGGDTRARTAKAIELFKNGWADKLIFSGAAYDKNSPSNAYAMSMQAINAGVPPSAITVEEFARDTNENALKTQKITDKQGVDRMILVTSAYHQRRASIEFKKVLTDVTVLNHPIKKDKQWNDNWWTRYQGWHLAIGELIKIFITYTRGSS